MINRFVGRRLRPPVLVSAVGIAALASSAGVTASTTETLSSALEEVVVTAQKREQNLQDVGISVTALTGDQLEKLNFASSAEFVAIAPNVESRQVWGGRGLNTLFSIRGVGQTDINDATESPVTAYVDEFYLISSAAVDFLLYDIERAEVMRGPQGTLFGRNATGGAIQFVTRKPQFSTGGAIDAEYGNFDTVKLDSHVNLPAGDRVAFRFSGAYEQHDPYVENINPEGDGIQEGDFLALRGQALAEPTDSLSLLFKYEYGRAEGHLIGDQHRPIRAVVGDAVRAPTDAFGYSETLAGVGSPKKVNANGLNFVDNRVDHLLARIAWEGDALTITSVTGYMDQAKEVYEDCDGGPVTVCADHVDFKSDHFTQELRFNGTSGDRLNWTAGGYYLRQDAAAAQDAALLFGPASAALGGGFTGLVFDVDWEQELESYALFGQLEYALSDQWTFIAGVRGSRDEKFFEQTKVDFLTDTAITNPGPGDFGSFPFAAPAGGVDFTTASAGDLTHMNENSVSGSVQLNWKPGEDVLVYGAVRRGVKSGGFNNGFINNIAVTSIPYGEETLHALEVGFKSTLSEGRVRLNAAAFYYDYEDYQASFWADLGLFVSNADARIYGAEAELAASPIDRLDIMLGASVLNTMVKDIPNRGVVKDREMGDAPSFTANATIRYAWDAFSGTLAAQTTAIYVGERYTDVLNNSALLLDDYAQVDASVDFTSGDERWLLSIYAKNLFDRNVPTSLFDLSVLGGIGQENYLPPRRIGVRVGFRF